MGSEIRTFTDVTFGTRNKMKIKSSSGRMAISIWGKSETDEFQTATFRLGKYQARLLINDLVEFLIGNIGNDKVNSEFPIDDDKAMLILDRIYHYPHHD